MAVDEATWNRWSTLGRYRKTCHCRLCQQRHTEDSIEHYAFCNTVRAVAARRLRLDKHSHVNLHTFTCTNPLLNNNELLIRTALLIYATYRALNHQRQADTAFQGEDLYHAMSQWITEGVRGHEKSSRVLSAVWIPDAQARQQSSQQ